MARVSAGAPLLGLAATVLFISCATSAPPRYDLLEHAALSAVSAFTVTAAAASVGMDNLPAWTAANAMTLAGGVAKETVDVARPRGSGWGWDDLGCDLAGSLVGSSVALVVLQAVLRAEHP